MFFDTCEETKREFELAVTSTMRTNWHSPLFYLVKKIKAQPSDPLHAALTAANTKLIADGTAYMLNVDASVKHIPLFPNTQYSLKERHYRIDQYYKMGTGTKQGLSAIHYTETYFAIHKGDHPQNIVIHVYLSLNAITLYSQVSPLTPLTAELTELFKSREKTLKENVHESKKLITTLLNEKDARFLSAKTQADDSEARLTELSRSLSTPNVLQEYIKKCKIFIQQIATANLYNDTPDSRGAYIATLLPKLQQRLEILQKIPSRSLKSPKRTKQCTDTTPDSEIVSINAPSSNPIESLVKETIENLSNYIKQIRENKITYPTRCIIKPNWEEISKTYPLIIEIKQYLLIAMCLPSGITKNSMEQITSFWNTLNVEIAEYEKYCLRTLAMSARNGNDTVFQSLFRLIKNDLKEIFYEELINALVISKKEPTIQSIIKTCEFLHAHSALYRVMVLKMSNEKQYYLDDALKKINPALTFNDLDKYQYGSLLFKIYIENNFQAFNLLLKHGANANTWSICYYQNDTDLIWSLLETIALYRTTNYLSYIDLLLKYDANPNTLYHPDHIIYLKSKDLEMSIQSKKAFHREYNQNLHLGDHSGKSVKLATKYFHPTIALDLTAGIILEALMIMGDINDSEGIRLLLPYSTVDILAMFLARTMHKDIFYIRMKLHTDPVNPWLKVTDNLEDANTMFLPNIESQAHPFLEYLIAPKILMNDQQDSLIQTNLLYIYVTYALLYKKLHSTVLSNDEFDQIYRLLLKSGIGAQAQNKLEEAYIRFLACEFLITTRIFLMKNQPEQIIILLKSHIREITSHLTAVCKQEPELVDDKLIKQQLKESLHILEIRGKAFKNLKISTITGKISAMTHTSIDFAIAAIPPSWTKEFPELFEFSTIKDSKTYQEEIASSTEERKANEENVFSLQLALTLPLYPETYFSEFLFMRPIFPLDYRSLKACFNDPHNIRYWSTGTRVKGRALKEQFIRHATRNLNMSYTSGWSIITHNGIAGCFWAWKNNSSTEVEFDFILPAEFARSGLATSAGELVLKNQYEYPDFIGKIIATVHPNSKASLCVLEELGLKNVPERQNVPTLGSVRNYYALEVEAPKRLILYSFNRKRNCLAEKQEHSIRKLEIG